MRERPIMKAGLESLVVFIRKFGGTGPLSIITQQITGGGRNNVSESYFLIDLILFITSHFLFPPDPVFAL